MSSVTLQPSGKFRGYAQVKNMREARMFERERDARTWADGTEKRMKAGTWEPAVRDSSGMTVTQAFEKYKTSEAWLEKAAGTTRKAEQSKQKPVIAALGSKRVRDLTADDVEDYIALRRKAKPSRSKDPNATMSGTSIRLEVAALSSMLNWAVKKKAVAVNVAKHVQKPKSNRRTTRMTDDYIGKIFEKDPIISDEVAYPFFRLLFTTGARPGELSHAVKENLRLDPPQLYLPRTKNDDERTIVLPLNLYELVEEHLERQPADCQYIFGTRKRDKSGWSPYNYAVPWKKALVEARKYGQVPADLQLVPYLARHEVISRLFERTTLNDGQIAGISGHRSAQALWHYKHLRNEHNRPVVEALDDMMTGIINRGISPSHPSKPLKIGELLTDKAPRKRKPRR